MAELFKVTLMTSGLPNYGNDKSSASPIFNFGDSIFGQIPQESKYEQLEKKQIKAYQEISEASKNGDMNKLNEINSDSYKLFKITPDGYMNLDKNEKMAVYKNSIEELAQGQLDKYDSGADGTMNKDEYLSMHQSIQTAIEDGKTPAEDLNSALNSDSFRGLSNTHFDVMDADENGALDKEEIAAGFAFTDTSKNVFDENMNKIEGEGMDGRVNIFADIIGELTPENIKESKEKYSQYHDFFFGAQ